MGGLLANIKNIRLMTGIKIIVASFLIFATIGTAIPQTAYADNASDLQYINNKMPELQEAVNISTRAAQEGFYKLRLIKALAKKIQESPNATEADRQAARTAVNNAESGSRSHIAFLKQAHNEVLTRLKWVNEMRAELAADETGISNCSGNVNCWKDFEKYKTEAYREAENVKGKVGNLNVEQTTLENIANRLKVSVTKEEKDKIQAAAKKDVPITALESCFYAFGVNVGICIQMGVGWILYAIAIIVAGLLQLAGMLFTYVIQDTVINIADNLGSIGAIGTIWAFFRDIANLSFIFILLYVAIGTMFQLQSVNWKKTLVRVIIAAILINFSLFFTKLIIDFSNIVAIGFYNQINTSVSTADGAIKTVSIADKFMDMFGIQAAFNDETVTVWSQSWSSLAVYGIGTIVVLFVTTFSFLAAAWLFIVRFAVIIILLILSPVAFASRAFPNLERQWSRWWDALMGQALFPPIYMLFIWATVTMGTQMFTGGGSLTDAFVLANSKDTSSTSVLIKYIVIIILLNTALALAKSQAGKVGGRMEKIMNSGMGYVDRFRDRTKAVATRNLINRPVRRIRQAYNNTIATGGKNIADSKLARYTGAAWVGSQVAKGVTAVGNTKVGRAAKAVGRAAQVAGKYTGVNATVGYLGKSAGIAVDRTINETLEAGEKYKVQGTENLAEYEKYVKGRGRALRDQEQEYDDKKAIADTLGEDIDKLSATVKEDVELITKISKVADRISVKELEEHGYDDLLNNEMLLASLDNNKFKSLLDSKELDLNDDQKKALKNKRKDARTKWAKHPGFGVLKDTQRKEIARAQEMERTGIDPTTGTALTKDSTGKYIDPATGKPVKVPSYGTFEEKAVKMKATDVADESLDVLLEMANNDLLTVQDVEQIVSKGTMSRADRARLRTAISARFGSTYAGNADFKKAVDASYERELSEYMKRNRLDPMNPAEDKKAKNAVKINQVRISPDVLVSELGMSREDAELTATQWEQARQVDNYFRSQRGLRF